MKCPKCHKETLSIINSWIDDVESMVEVKCFNCGFMDVASDILYHGD